MQPDHPLTSSPPSTSTGGHGRSRYAAADFAEARAIADRAVATQKVLASRTVAVNSLDAGDCQELLSMLGLLEPERDTAPQHHRQVPAQTRDPRLSQPHRGTPGLFWPNEGARG